MTRSKKVMLVIAAVVLFCIAALVALGGLVFVNDKKVQMDGPSMEPTFSDGDILRLDSDLSELERGDVIVYERDAVLFIKRIIGLPGESIEFREQGVYVEGELLKESYLSALAATYAFENSEYTTAEDEYFVLGDNRPVSLDSRMERHGMVSKDEIVGIVKQ